MIRIMLFLTFVFILFSCKEEPKTDEFINPVSYLLPAEHNSTDVDMFAIVSKLVDNNNFISPEITDGFTIYIGNGSNFVDCDSVLFSNFLLENMTEFDGGSPLVGQYSLDDKLDITSYELKLLNYLSQNFTLQLSNVNDLILNNYLLSDTVSISEGLYSNISGYLNNPKMFVNITASEIHTETLIHQDSTYYNKKHIAFELSNNGILNLTSNDLKILTPNRYYFVNVKTTDFDTYNLGSKKLGVYYENVNRTLIYLTN